MKLVVCQADLDHALRTVAPAIGVRSSHPIMECCLITAEASTITVTGFNLDLGITCTVPATVSTTGAIALPYRLLAGLVSRLEGDEAITIADGTITAISGSYSLAAQSAEDFPDLPVVEASEDQLALSGAVRRCMVAVSTDASKAMLTGIHLGDGHMAATDGHRLMRVAVDLPAGLALTVPASTMKLLADHTCTIAAAKGQAVITTDEGIRVYSRILDGTYPNVASLIPTSFKHTMTINRHRLTRALERVAIIAEAHNSIIKLTAADGELVITAEADANNGRETIAYDGTSDGSWAFNVTYLLDGLKAFKPAETIELCANAATTPVVLRPLDQDDVTYLVMPVQIRT